MKKKKRGCDSYCCIYLYSKESYAQRKCYKSGVARDAADVKRDNNYYSYEKHEMIPHHGIIMILYCSQQRARQGLFLFKSAVE